MDATYWHKQSHDTPLFESLIWSKPENKMLAGKLLIIGGNAHAFAAVGEAYAEAEKAGVGTAKVLLPDALQKTVGSVLENGEFAPTNKSGSFAKNALAEWLSFADWADAVLLAGDMGRNSETAVLLESFVGKYQNILIVTKDVVDYFSYQPQKIINRPTTTIVLSLSQLQKLVSRLEHTTPVKFSMTIEQLVELLHELTTQYPANIITCHNGIVFVAAAGQVSTTKAGEDSDIWRVKTTAHAAVWWLQNSNKPFEALTTSVIVKSSG